MLSLGSQYGGIAVFKNFSSALCACFVAGSSISAATAQGYDATATAAQPATGQNVAVAGGRSLRVLVAQSEIKSDINLSNIAVATGGGILGGLIAAAVDSARAKKAEVLIAPVRTAMANVDGDALSIETAKASFANAEWYKADSETNFSKDNSPAGKSAYLDTSANAQTAFVEYTYDLSPEFDALRIIAKIDVAAKNIALAKGKPEKRLSPKNLVYSRSVASVILLPTPSKEKEANAARWAADNAKLTRSALAQSFARLQVLMPRVLAMNSNEEVALSRDKKNKRIMAGGFFGRPQSAANGTTLLWTGGGFVEVAPLH